MLFEGGFTMKEYLKGLVTGIVIGAIGLTTVFAAGSIKTATFNENQVIYNGQTLSLSQPMISVVKEGEKNVSNYMPVRAVLESMGYTVDWDSSKNAVVIDGNGTTEILDPEMEIAVNEFTKKMNEEMTSDVKQAIEQLKNNEDYKMMKALFSKLEPAAVWVLMAEDYQVWITDGECLFPEVWETLAQY